MDFQPITYPVDKLVSLIRSGRLALPEFQREFVWSPHKVVELIDSVARGWPVGSLLLLRGPQPFEAREIDAGPALHEEVDLFVLDGQQRITALYHAVADVSDIAYYIDFNALQAGVGDYIVWRRRSEAKRELDSVEVRAKNGIALISEVVDNQLFFNWQSHLARDRAQAVLQLREIQLSGLKAKVYRLPVIELEHEIELEALARIFETINRTGVRLNAFDLMVAVLYPHQFYLRSAWEDAIANHDLLREYEVDGVEVLKLIAIWARRRQQQERTRVTVRGVRQGDVLAIPPMDVKNNWERAVDSYVQALGFLRNSLGAVNASLAPPQAMILALAAFCDSGLDTAISKDQIVRWYWASVALQSYAQGANTKVVSDVERAGRSDFSGLASEVASVLSPAFYEPVRRNKILLNGIGSAFVLSGAEDVVDGEKLSDVRDDPIAWRSLWALERGETRPSESVLVSEVVFAKERSFARLAYEVRRGKSARAVMNTEALKTQFAHGLDVSERANRIKSMLEGMFSQSLGGEL